MNIQHMLCNLRGNTTI